MDFTAVAARADGAPINWYKAFHRLNLRLAVQALRVILYLSYKSSLGVTAKICPCRKVATYARSIITNDTNQGQLTSTKDKLDQTYVCSSRRRHHDA